MPDARSQRRVDLIVGARPNFMKIAPIVRAIEAAQARGSNLAYRIVHTGQHYDRAMSASFFEQLDIPEPDVNLNVGSGSQAEQSGRIMLEYERLVTESACDLCLVVGDVNSTLSCAITAQKCKIRVAHVEGGIRSGDWGMPEEINRRVTDSISNYFFTTSETANRNLLDAGASPDQVLFVGNTMIDTLLQNKHRFAAPPIWQAANLQPKGYLVLTLHRPSNVDDLDQLRQTLEFIARHAEGRPVVFPAHPRTQKQLEGSRLDWDNLHRIPPLGYLEFNYLVQHALGVITDSGGITEEATVLHVPCITLRDTTERPETVTIGTNELVGTDASAMLPHLATLFAGNWRRGGIPPLWDGKAGSRIVDHLERIV